MMNAEDREKGKYELKGMLGQYEREYAKGELTGYADELVIGLPDPSTIQLCWCDH